MKQVFAGIGLIAAACFLILSCSKSSSKNQRSTGSAYSTLSLSQTAVQRGQPLIASLPAGTSAAAVKWSVSTRTPTHITAANGQAQILFSASGHYHITAVYSAADSSYSDTAVGTIDVQDTSYTPPPPVNTDTSSLAGDQITLTPSFDSLGNLLFTAQTGNSYGCAPYLVSLLYEDPGSGGLLTLNFYEVISNGAGTCHGVENPAVAFLFTTTGNRADGTYPIKVNFGTSIYTGSLTIAGSSYSFNWDYHSGVLISPLQLSK
jgi:hypothetical protein